MFIEERQNNLKQQILKESRTRFKEVEQLEDTLSKDFPALQAQLLAITENRTNKANEV